ELKERDLPLTPGRRVAFHQKPSAAAAEGGKEEGWILAQITECLGGDKNKYRVQDVDYDPTTTNEQGCVAQLRSTAEGAMLTLRLPRVFNTTIKYLIPLPDKHGKSMYDIPVGSAVMALYPDTTSFYRAVIVSGPEMLQVDKGKQKKERVYFVTFDDDDNAVRKISVEMVVEVP
ncbi:SAGA-associated factor 29, partial [Phenoliferia sp. Uapishka_3]